MYIVGTFTRDTSLMSRRNPLWDAGIKEEITKEDLIKCRKDRDHQVIDIEKKKYFDPTQNRWIDLTEK